MLKFWFIFVDSRGFCIGFSYVVFCIVLITEKVFFGGFSFLFFTFIC